MTHRKSIPVGLLALSVWLWVARVSPGQDPPDPDVLALQERISQFLEGVSASPSNTKAAYDDLLENSPLAKRAKEELPALIEKTNELEDHFGRYHEFEPIGAKRVGKDLVLLKYLYKCEDFPVVWYFTFYRTPRADIPPEQNDWRAIVVRFDTELELLGP
ncbi:MAG: hypothetical protein ACYTG0_27390 [Planctomycetota bacterium]|jgi:hypothetical protein